MPVTVHTKESFSELCPECSAILVSAEIEINYNGKVQQHCNGRRWETVVYLCGRKDQYSPSSSRVEHLQKCNHFENERQRAAEYKAVKGRLVEQIALLTDDPDFKKALRNSLGVYSD